MKKKNTNFKRIVVAQILPSLDSGGVERGTLEVGKFLADQDHRSIVISSGGRMKKQLISEGSEHFELNIGRKSLFTLRHIPYLINFLIKNNVDIVHVRSRFPAWIIFFTLKFIRKDSRPHFITTVHGFNSIGIYSSVMTKGEKVIAVSKTIKKFIKKNYHVPEENIYLNYRGVDPKVFIYGFKPSKKYMNDWFINFPQTKNKILLLFPSRITRRKGHEDFISLINNLKDKFPNIHGLIVGESLKDKIRYENELKNKVIKLSLNNFITFTGHRSDLRNIMSISSIVYSLSNKPEAFGRTVIESIKLGIPVIGFNHGGVGEQLSEIFPQGKISPGDKNDLFKTTCLFIKNPPKVLKTDLYTLEGMLKNTLSLYKITLKYF